MKRECGMVYTFFGEDGAIVAKKICGFPVQDGRAIPVCDNCVSVFIRACFPCRWSPTAQLAAIRAQEARN